MKKFQKGSSLFCFFSNDAGRLRIETTRAGALTPEIYGKIARSFPCLVMFVTLGFGTLRRWRINVVQIACLYFLLHHALLKISAHLPSDLSANIKHARHRNRSSFWGALPERSEKLIVFQPARRGETSSSRYLWGSAQTVLFQGFKGDFVKSCLMGSGVNISGSLPLTIRFWNYHSLEADFFQSIAKKNSSFYIPGLSNSFSKKSM